MRFHRKRWHPHWKLRRDKFLGRLFRLADSIGGRVIGEGEDFDSAFVVVPLKAWYEAGDAAVAIWEAAEKAGLLKDVVT